MQPFSHNAPAPELCKILGEKAYAVENETNLLWQHELSTGKQYCIPCQQKQPGFMLGTKYYPAPTTEELMAAIQIYIPMPKMIVEVLPDVELEAEGLKDIFKTAVIMVGVVFLKDKPVLPQEITFPPVMADKLTDCLATCWLMIHAFLDNPTEFVKNHPPMLGEGE